MRLAALLLLAGFAPAAGAVENPWFLHVRRSYRDSSVAMNYQVRWDFSDLKRSPRELAVSLAAPLKTLDSGLRGMLHSTRLDLYGVRVRPFRDFVRVEPPAEEPAPSSGATEPAAKPRRRIDIDPLLDDARRDARREAKRFVITMIFDAALPQARGAPWWQKEAAAEDLVALTRAWGSEF